MLTVRATLARERFALDVQLCLQTPGIIALFGRSGAGKSTLLNIIAGLTRAAAGCVELDGRIWYDSTQRVHVPAERRGIGYVFQDSRLFPHLSVAGNLRYALSRARRDRDRPQVASFDAVVELLDLEGLLMRRTHALSGGERQRVAIGRALLTQPYLLLLDEPLAALDASRREEVLPYLEALRDHLALPMVYVSHNFDDAWRIATELVLLDAGRTVAQGSMSQMSLHPGVRAIIGADAVGAVIEGTVLGSDPASGLTRVAVGDGELRADWAAPRGSRLRVQVLARDVIIATEPPRHLSVRNVLAGVVLEVSRDTDGADLITIDIGATPILARVTQAASAELQLARGQRVWALVKSVSLRGHAQRAAALGAT